MKVRKVASLVVFIFIFGLFNFNSTKAFGERKQDGGFITIHLTKYEQIDDIANAFRIVHRSKNYKFLSSKEYEELNWIIHRDEKIIQKGKHKGENNPYFGSDNLTEKVKQRLKDIMRNYKLNLSKLEKIHNDLVKKQR